MPITKERAELLAKYLMDDKQRLEQLMAMPAEAAAAKINADGYDFSTDELVAFAEELEKQPAQKNGELSEDDLDNVTGGGVGAFLLGSIAWYLIEKALDNAWNAKPGKIRK